MSLFVSTLYCPLRSGLPWARRIVWWSISTAYRAYYLAHDAKRIRHFLIDIYILAGRVIIFWPCIRSCWSAEVHRNVHALSLPSIGIKWRWKLMMGVMVTYTSDKMENNSSCIAQKWRSNDLLTQTRNAPIYTPWVAKGIVKIKKIPVRIYHESSPKPYGPRGLQYNFFIAHSKMNMPFVYTIFTSLFFFFFSGNECRIRRGAIVQEGYLGAMI